MDKEVVENIGNRDDGAYMHGHIEVAGGTGSHYIGGDLTRQGAARVLLCPSSFLPTDPKEVSHQPHKSARSQHTTLQSALHRNAPHLPPSIRGEHLAALVG